MPNAFGFSPPCCCDDVCIVLALEQPEDFTLGEDEYLGWEILLDTDGNSGTGLVHNGCGPDPSDSAFSCCDDWHYVIGVSSTDGTGFTPGDCVAECPPEDLDYAGATCGLCFSAGAENDGPCAAADGGILDFDFFGMSVVFVKNPTDGHIWIGVRHYYEFAYLGTGGRCGQGSVNGWLDTGLTSLTYPDFPFEVPIDVDCVFFDNSCWSTPGTTTVDLNPVAIPL